MNHLNENEHKKTKAPHAEVYSILLWRYSIYGGHNSHFGKKK